MLMSKLLGERYKEKPVNANLISHIYLLRGGYIRPVSNGIYSILTPAKRVLMKIEEIVRKEMDGLEGQEVLFPVVIPASLWEETGRYETVGEELIRFTDRHDTKMVLGMTHEELAVHLGRTEAKSYTKYPFMIYQLQTKFRDEPRARGGLIRIREFLMKDAYSFHLNEADLKEYYNKVHEAYVRIYSKLGLKNVISVGSDTGMMGGSVAHEFMYLSDNGEDSLIICDSCGYKSNMEVAESNINFVSQKTEFKYIPTPNIRDIENLSEFLNLDKSKLVKAVIFSIEDSQDTLVVFIRGDFEVNEAKLKRVINKNITTFVNYKNVDLCYGYIGPYNLNVENLKVVYDKSLEGTVLTGGANKQDFHIEGLDMDAISNKEYVDVRKVCEQEQCIICKGKLKIKRGIEVGNIFQLGKKYTKTMKMDYIDKNGLKQIPTMGCYGLGISRVLACLVEENHDDKGIVWPISVSPWEVHICILNNKNNNIIEIGTQIYDKLKEKYEVICDDRNLAPGVQFAEADLLGVPIRIIVSARNIENDQVEISTRDKSINIKVNINDIEKEIEKIYTALKI